MKTINKILFTIIIALPTLFLVSCDDYLDVSSELADNLTIDKVFESADYTKRWHGNIFNCIIEYSRNASSADAMGNPWSGVSGELMLNNGPSKNLMVSGYTPGNAGLHRWATQYSYIRQALLFIDRAHAIGEETAGSNRLEESEVLRMKDEAKFLIAYAYFTLLELYGPVPIVDTPADPEDKGLDYARASMDEVIEYIDNLLKEVLEAKRLNSSIYNNEGEYNLQSMVRPTLTVVYALRAKLWVYAASKLFNGGFAESLTISNTDGSKLFPTEDRNKWQIAKQRLEEFLNYAHAQGHKLHEEYVDGAFDPHESVYQVFQKYNDEIIWATAYNEYSNPNNQERRSNPVDLYSSPTNFANIGVSQETVDAFFMENGLDIKDKYSGYKEDGFTTVANPCNVAKREDTDIFNMYANREPRFYASVGYNGRSWHIHTNANYRQWFARDKTSDITKGDNCPRGGYLFYKFKHRRIAQGTTSITVNGKAYTVYTSWARPSIIFRLADFYLYYAEVLNEINPSDPNIIEYIDKVRTRAGIPGYQELAAMGRKNIIGNKDAQFKAIVQERHVELLGEGQRWFDMRRWMICDPVPENQPDKSGMDGDITRFTGMNMYGYDNVTTGNTSKTPITRTLGDDDSFYKRIQIENRSWKKEMYWYPVPQNEINKSRLLVQNPLWTASIETPEEPTE